MISKKRYNKVELRKRLENFERIEPDIDHGLDSEQTEKRIASGLVNYHDDRTRLDLRVILFKNIFTFFNLLNFIIALMLFSVGAYRNLLFIGVVVFNTLIGIVQEIRAKIEIDKITLLTKSFIRVIRNKKNEKIRSDHVVIDDILCLGTGDEIPADCRIKSVEVRVNESILTGEAEQKTKKHNDILYAGSFITSGNCFAKVEFVGTLNYCSEVIDKAKKYKKANSPLINAIRMIIRTISFFIIPIGTAIFYIHFFIDKNGLYDVVTTTAASVIGMIPEGLVLLTSITLTVGVLRLAKKRILVKELYSIENLARVDTVCFDKTGTITTGDMIVRNIKYFYGKNDSCTDESVSGYIKLFDNSTRTIGAIKNFYNGKKAVSYNCEKQIFFSSEKKFSGIVTDSEIIILGAYDIILGNDEGLKEIVRISSSEDDRILLLAKTCLENFNVLMSDEAVDFENLHDIDPICAFYISDEIRKNITGMVSYLYSQGVDIKVISGDEPLSVAHISAKAGILGTDSYIDMSKLTEPEIMAMNVGYTVFGRVKPNQKSALVKRLKAAGQKVAMVGDGINDVMALREADCSISPAAASAPALNVSQIVLLDSSYEHIPAVIGEGRRVINNIGRSASLFLIKTFMSVMLAAATIALPFFEYPFIPIQLTLISSLFIGVPSYFLSLEKNLSLVKGKLIRTVFLRALPFSAIIFVGILCLNIYNRFFGFDEGIYTLSAVLYTAFCFFCSDIYLCKPFKRYHAVLLGATAATFSVAFFMFGDFFLFDLPKFSRLLLFFSSALFIFIYFYIVKVIFKKYTSKIKYFFIGLFFLVVIALFLTFYGSLNTTSIASV